MDDHLKKRLVGATVLVALAVIFIPMLVDDEAEVDTRITQTNIPPRPNAPFSSRIQPLELKEKPAAAAAEPKPLKEPVPVAPVSLLSKTAAKPVTSKESSPKPAEPKVAITKPPAKPIVSWVIQVGSFAKQENANNLVKQLRAMKFAAFMEKVVVDGKTRYRVRVGPEVDQKKAQQMQAQIEKKFKLKGKLERYP